ncbi:DUF2637 domain-containing protein [Frankia sp. AgB32]|uniref:DUF2637 domain-containing protein n=1 Tax=Frankia sp. AgB32 TaxID=631119 RepID=UPI00200C3BF7|nr:DUF2637 domain-containing protein [Frankia sp. AgB32]MCK9895763.1 DUF2637 domain-containing protein [Frankia sp. AgB32]
MDGGQPTSGGRSAGTRAERTIRITTVVAVATVAAVAAFVSYRHMRGVAMVHGEDSLTATVLPFSVDGLIVAASMAMLADRRAGRRRSMLAYLLLALGACASLVANVLHAEATVTARIIAGWPPLALLGSYELLMRQIHPAGRRNADGPGQPVTSIPQQRDPTPAAPDTVPAARTAPPPSAPQPSTTQPTPVPAPSVGDDPVRAESPGAVLRVDDGPGRAVPQEAGSDRATLDRAIPDQVDSALPEAVQSQAASSAGMDGAADPAAKREAIARALDETSGSVTATVAVLAAQGIAVSRSWVYQVRKETSPADVGVGRASRGAHRTAVRGRRRGMATERALHPTSQPLTR